MKDKIIEKLKGKKIALLGFGREGKATYSFIRNYFENLSIWMIRSDIWDNSDRESDKKLFKRSRPSYNW